MQRYEGGIPLIERSQIGSLSHRRFEIAVGLGIMDRGAAAIAVQDQLYAAEIALYLADARNCSGRVKNARGYLIDVFFLSDGENSALRVLQCSLDAAERRRAARAYGRRNTRKTGRHHAAEVPEVSSDRTLVLLWGPANAPTVPAKTSCAAGPFHETPPAAGLPSRRGKANLRPTDQLARGWQSGPWLVIHARRRDRPRRHGRRLPRARRTAQAESGRQGPPPELAREEIRIRFLRRRRPRTPVASPHRPNPLRR